MILGIDPVSTIAAGVLLAKAAAVGVCSPLPTGRADVELTVREQPYITSLSSAELTAKYGSDLNTSASTHGKWMVGGLTASNIQVGYKIAFNGVRDTRTNNICLSIDNVRVDIAYSPAVYIASDYVSMGCRYSSTVLHEKRHVDTGVRSIRAYIPRIEKEIEEKIKALGTSGPYPQSNIEAVKQNIGQLVGNAINAHWSALEETNRAAQAKIDTIENYKRDTALCPDQFPKFE